MRLFQPIITGSISATGSFSITGSVTSNYGFTGSLFGTASQAISASYVLTASYVNPLIQTVSITGSLITTGSNTLIGITELTGALNITGSTTQIGNNTLIGNTTLSGSIIISGSQGQPNPTISVFGDLNQTGYTRYLPVTNNIDNSVSASYIYVSGSTQDLYFAQNSKGYANTTRLRWLEGNLYTGLLNGGLITSQSSTAYQISSGSGIIVNLNASLNDNPYPTIQYLNWSNLSASIAPLTASYQQAFVGVQSNGTIFAQGTPFANGQFDALINIGTVLFQNQSTINGVKTQPSVAYGFEQRQSIFTRAFGPLKLSGFTLAPSGSSTGSLIVGSGTAYADGANYPADPNDPSYVVDNGTNVSKIFRYYDSGSTWVYNTNGGAGFATIDPTKYSNNGTLTTVQPNDWSVQRVFWFPNSVAKAIVVYYGNASYDTEAEAAANIPYEPFIEAPNTAANAIYLGAIVISGNGIFTNTSTFKILPGGLFRQVGGSGGGGSVVTQTLAGLSDVDISGQTNLQPLAYSTTAAKWINTSILSASVVGNATTATSASYAATSSWAIDAVNATTASYVTLAQTASYVENAQTASYVLLAQTASYVETAQTASYVVLAQTASYVENAQTASYILNAVSASYASTASYVTLAQTASYVENAQTASYIELAQTASYVLNAVSASYALSASYAPGSDTSISASYALSASYATTASFASNLTDQGIVFCSTASTLWSAQHNLDTLTPIVNVYDSNNVQLIPASITSLNYNVTQIAFSTPVSGCAVISKGSGLSSVSALTASYALTASMVLDQGFNYCNSTASTVWNIVHNLNTTSPLVDVYNSSNSQVIPASITSLDANTTQIDFSVATAGCAILSRGSGLSSVAVVSASFATTSSFSISASYAENVRTVCYTALTGSTVWTIPHNFGCKYVMANVYDNNDDAIIPNRINLTDSNTTTIYFTVPTSGTALLIPANCCGTPTTTTSTTTTTTTAEPTTTTSTTTSTTTAEPTTTTSTTTSTTTTVTPTTTTSTTTSTTTAASYAYTLYSSTGYSSAGDACTNQPIDPSSTVYAAEFLIGSVTRFYSDSNLATPIVGGDQWWAFGDGVQIYRAQISNGGFLTNNASC